MTKQGIFVASSRTFEALCEELAMDEASGVRGRLRSASPLPERLVRPLREI